MDSVQYPDSIYLSAAQGWLELGNSVEAAAELDRMGEVYREHPDVFRVRWQLAAKDRRWSEALELSQALCELVPEDAFGWIHRSYCLHELRRTQEAWDALLPMAKRFPRDWLIAYNLACYACQLGLEQEARTWLQRACELGDAVEIKRMATTDPDLRGLFAPPG